ncbi:MAG: response regulator transcription factor [Rhizobiaceae bacterium]|nr:response regulator transcription factor [Rhizobiaceae bacterium]
MARIVLVDDHPVFRQGLESLIDLSGEHELVASLEDKDTLSHTIETTKADLVVLDLSLKSGMSFDEIARLKRSHPALLVLVLSMHDEPEFITRALESGADGYALKQDAFEDLDFAIRSVLRGGRFVSPTILAYQEVHAAAPSDTDVPDRQREILVCLERGLSNKQIASELGIALPTVKNHLTVLFKKYQVQNRTMLARKIPEILRN